MLDKAVTLKLNCPHLYFSVSITTSISHQTTWRKMWIDNCGKMFGFGHGKLNTYVTLTQFTTKYLFSEVKTLKTFIITICEQAQSAKYRPRTKSSSLTNTATLHSFLAL